MRLHDPANRVRWWIAFALTALLVSAVAVPVATLVIIRERSAVTVADEIVVRIGDRTSDLVASELATATRSLELLSRLVETDSGADGTTTDRILATQVQSIPQLSGAYVAFPDGAFRFVRRDGRDLILKLVIPGAERAVTEARIGDDLEPLAAESIDDDYDPRTRPWFSAAIETGGQIWTDPYVFFASGQPGITAALAIRDDDGVVTAVVGVDLALAQMSSFLDDIPIDDAAEAFIIAGDAVVAAPSSYDLAQTDGDGNYALATLDRLGFTSRELAAAIDQPTPLQGRDDDRLYAHQLDDPMLPPWDVAVRTGKIEFVDVVGRQSRTALVATIVAALALLAVIPLMVVGLRRPIDELNRRGRFDPLTGLLNRNALFEDGQRELRQAYKSGDEVTLAVIDIDDFKSVNDTYGHGAGDQAIRRVGRALRESVRPQDLVGRLGGDEFVVIMSGLDPKGASVALEQVRQALVMDVTEGSGHVSSVTIGATRLADRALHIERLIAEADHALIEAKRNAKGTVAAG